LIHYHGTPITPHSERQKMAGKNFCVSYFRPEDAAWCLNNGQSVMWDNGAFSAYTQNKIFDFHGYIKWVEQYLAHPHWAVIPDVIDGSVEENETLLLQWPYAKELSAPVWHMGLSIDWLLKLADNFPRFCFGSTGSYWQIGSDIWARRADEAWNALVKHGHKSWVHMMRGLSLAGDRWPFASADSTNVARNFKNKDAHVCPERMARRIDAVQCPIKWTVKETQKDLFGSIE